MAYRLETKGNRGKKGRCPKCQKEGKFSYYRDTSTGERILNVEGYPDPPGKCDRQNSCGYWFDPNGYKVTNTVYVPPEPPKITIYPDSVNFPALETVKKDYGSPFHEWVKAAFKIPDSHLKKWMVRTHHRWNKVYTVFGLAKKSGETVQLLNLYFIPYDHTGHRLKPTEKSKNNAYYLPPPDKEKQEYSLCLYGEHLLDPAREKVVCLVESPKTAFLGAAFYPAFDWLATIGHGIGDKYTALHNRKVILLPDADEAGRKGYAGVAKKLEKYGIQYQVLDLFLSRTDGYDLADALCDGSQPVIEWKSDQAVDWSGFKLKDYNPLTHAKIKVSGVFVPDPQQPPTETDPVLWLWDYRTDKSWGLAGAGDIATFQTPSKGGKTTLTEVIRACALGLKTIGSDGTANPKKTLGYDIKLPPGKKMLHIDTEMSQKDVYDSMRLSFWRAGLTYSKNNPLLDCYGLSAMKSLAEKQIFVFNLLYSGEYGVVIWDGIMDMVRDYNSLTETGELYEATSAAINLNKICLIATIHLNEKAAHASQHALGHLGSLLRRKSRYVGTMRIEGNIRIIDSGQNGGRKLPENLATAMVWDDKFGGFVYVTPPDETSSPPKRRKIPERQEPATEPVSEPEPPQTPNQLSYDWESRDYFVN